MAPTLVKRLKLTLHKRKVPIRVGSAFKHSKVHTVSDFVSLALHGVTHVFYVTPIGFDAILGKPYLNSDKVSAMLADGYRKDPSVDMISKRFVRLNLGNKHTAVTTVTTTEDTDLLEPGIVASVTDIKVTELPRQIQHLLQKYPYVFTIDLEPGDHPRPCHAYRIAAPTETLLRDPLGADLDAGKIK